MTLSLPVLEMISYLVCLDQVTMDLNNVVVPLEATFQPSRGKTHMYEVTAATPLHRCCEVAVAPPGAPSGAAGPFTRWNACRKSDRRTGAYIIFVSCGPGDKPPPKPTELSVRFVVKGDSCSVYYVDNSPNPYSGLYETLAKVRPGLGGSSAKFVDDLLQNKPRFLSDKQLEWSQKLAKTVPSTTEEDFEVPEIPGFDFTIPTIIKNPTPMTTVPVLPMVPSATVAPSSVISPIVAVISTLPSLTAPPPVVQPVAPAATKPAFKLKSKPVVAGITAPVVTPIPTVAAVMKLKAKASASKTTVSGPAAIPDEKSASASPSPEISDDE